MEAQAKEQARLALLAQEQARVAAEAAQRLAAARLAALPQPGPTIKDCADCPEMVVIPAGSFDMGSNEYPDERPVHRVNVPSFLIGKAEVTQGQWRAVMGSNPSSFSSCGDDCPAEVVSWNDAQEFAQRLSQKTGKRYRLPSEAEWEYAARAGSSTKWSFGDSEYQLGDYAWFFGNSQFKTQRVAQKRSNAFGLFDMHGNVWEWVQDCWHGDYTGAPTDGSAWTTGCSSISRVLRGGSWSSSPAILRSAFRDRNAPGNRNGGSGLRLALSTNTPPLPTAGSAGAGASKSDSAASEAARSGPIADPRTSPKVVYFDYNSSEIKPEGAELIDAHARFLIANRTRQVSLEGHTDERSGSSEFSLALSKKRADAVRTRMRLLGVTDIQMEAVSFGKEKPAAAGNDDAAQAKNRRAEINYAR